MILADICIRRPVFATMLIGALVVLGLFSYQRLGVDFFPDVQVPTVTISTSLPGASPEELETQVTKPIEEAVNTVSGIDELRSTTFEGLSQVIVIFEKERDFEAATQDVRDTMATILADLPEEADPPLIEKFNVDATPILYATVKGNRSLRGLTELAEDRVKEPLESVVGVGAIELLGGREREIQVLVDAVKLGAYRLSVSEVARALAAQNVEIPGGRLVLGSHETVVRTLGRFQNLDDILDVRIATREGRPIYVRDIATVEDGTKEARGLSRYNGQNAVTLAIRKQSGSNTVALVDALKARMSVLVENLPEGVTLEINQDQSTFIRAATHEVQNHMIYGAVMASVVVLVFMGSWRATLIAALAIPTSVIATFALMYAAGFSLNMLTLMGLTLAVGIVIDDAIVVLENIWRFLDEKGMDRFEAAHAATEEVGLAVTATTLSLTVVFVPLAFVPGIIGDFLESFGWTMAFAIMVSLLVAFTLTPALSARLLKTDETGNEEASNAHRFYAPIERGYIALVRWSLEHRLTVTLFALGIALTTPFLAKLTGSSFMPHNDEAEFEVDLRLPQGSSLEQVDRTLSGVEAAIQPIPEVNGLLTLVGQKGSDDVTAAKISVTLSSVRERKRHQLEIMQEVRERLEPFRSHLRVSVNSPPPLAGSGLQSAELVLQVLGPDRARLERAATDLRAIMETTPGVVDLDSNFIPGKPEVQIEIDRARAYDLGVSAADVASTIRTFLSGLVVTEYKETEYKELDDLYDVRLRLSTKDRERPEQLTFLEVPSERGEPVPLGRFVRLRPGTGPAEINRQNRQRQITLSGNLEPGYAFGDVLNSIVQRAQQELDLTGTLTLNVSGRGELFEETAAGFQLALVLSLVFMYMILAAQFESFLHPITIMLSLPLVLPFAILSLWMFGSTLNLFSGLGILLLFGIVKKNSILQIDHTLQLQRSGKPRDEAIVEANRDRLRPILMTTISFVVALIPAAITSGEGSGAVQAMAVVVIGGQSLCLLVTLLVTPVAYSLFDDLTKYLRLS